MACIIAAIAYSLSFWIPSWMHLDGAPCFSGSCSEVYLEKAFDGDGLRPVKRLPVARELGETSLMFLVHPTLTEKDMETVADIVKKVMMEASL